VTATVTAPDTYDCRVAFAEEIAALAREDERIVAVCNDSVGSSNLVAFGKEFPDRLINVGIAEQDMVGVAAGLAGGGYIPFVCAAAPFLTGRATEQIKADVAYSRAHVILCGMSPGMAYGALGPTHHSIEDFAWMRAIAGLTVLAPADPDETRGAVRWAAGSGPGQGPARGTAGRTAPRPGDRAPPARGTAPARRRPDRRSALCSGSWSARSSTAGHRPRRRCGPPCAPLGSSG